MSRIRQWLMKTQKKKPENHNCEFRIVEEMAVNNKVEVPCEYKSEEWLNNWYYFLNIEIQEIPPNAELTEFIGQHQNWKTSEDVTGIYFLGCKMAKVPRGLTKVFPNLKFLGIDGSNLTKLTQADLAEYKSFQGFKICDNDELEFLPGNLFENFENLEIVDFQYNSLRLIEPQILDGLNKLKHVNFSGNPNYEKYYLSLTGFPSNATLDEVKTDLLAKFHANDSDPTPESQAVIEKLRRLRLESREPAAEGKRAKPAVSAAPSTSSLSAFFQQDDSFKDFRITISNREFRVHKLLLAARSPTIAEMLRNNPEADCLNLVDIPTGIFEQILNFIYTDELPDGSGSSKSDNETDLALFAAAGRLKIEDLKNHAALLVEQQLGQENALEVLKMSSKYGHDGLKIEAFEQVKQKYPRIEFEDEWMDDAEKVEKIVEIFEAKEAKIRELEEELKKFKGTGKTAPK